MVDGGGIRWDGRCGVSPGSVDGKIGGKVSWPMSSVMSESVDTVILGFVEVRSDVVQRSPAMAASRLSPIAKV